MKSCLIIGRTNVGKTEFALRFAESCGMTNIQVQFIHPDGVTMRKRLSLSAARQELVSAKHHSTRSLQELEITLPVRKTTYRLKLLDTAGLIDGIHTNVAIRYAMAQTLRQLSRADIVIHLIDAALVAENGPEIGISAVDYQIARFMEPRAGYFICANKLDLPDAENGLAIIKAAFPQHLVLGTSALTGRGIKEVKRVVARAL